MAEHIIGPLKIRDNDGPHEPGWRMERHGHSFDHVTIVAQGVYRCWRWSKAGVLVSDTIVKAGPGLGATFFNEPSWGEHAFECVEGPGYLYCVFPHRDPVTKEIVERWNGWQGASV